MRKRSVVVLVMAALAAILPSGIARANGGDPSSAAARPPAVPGLQRTTTTAQKTFTFYGSGWGHGVGMSQWGSYGLALKGWNVHQILSHYYTGATIGQAPAGSPDVVRVGLAWDRQALHLKAVGGPVALRFGAPTNKDKFTIPKGVTWTAKPTAAGHFLLINAVGKPVKGTPFGGPTWKMFAITQANVSQLRITEAGHPYGRGVIEFNVYRPCHGCTWLIRAVGVMSVGEYLYGLGEVPSSWPMDAMESQAVAARTWVLRAESGPQGMHRTDHGQCGCGVYPSTIDQAYIGWDKEADSYAHFWRQAVDRTGGQVLLYGGQLILANYYSSSGGYTESNENVWGGAPIPYLRSVCDPGDYSAPTWLRTWTVPLKQSEVSQDFSSYGVGTVTSMIPNSRSPNSGRILSITIKGTTTTSTGTQATTKSVTVSGPTFSAVLGLFDDKVWINRNRNIEGAIRTRYDSLMCAPGLAMTAAFAVQGGRVQRFAQGGLFVNSALGRTVWLRGPEYGKYRSLGGAGSFLGLPRSGPLSLDGRAGCGGADCSRASFDHGRIYDKSGVGTFEVHGPVLAYFLHQGGASGGLGFPTSDVTPAGGGAVRSTFEHGTVTCPASGACSQS